MEKIVILLGIFLISIAFVMHAPIFKINKKIKKQIIEKGLIHFTSIESANNILVEGFHGNYSTMIGEGKLGKLVWTYLYSDDINRYHQYLVNKKRGRKNPNNFQVCLRIRGFSNETLDKMYMNIGFFGDRAIVYKGNYLNAQEIEIIKKW